MIKISVKFSKAVSFSLTNNRSFFVFHPGQETVNTFTSENNYVALDTDHRDGLLFLFDELKGDILQAPLWNDDLASAIIQARVSKQVGWKICSVHFIFSSLRSQK